MLRRARNLKVINLPKWSPFSSFLIYWKIKKSQRGFNSSQISFNCLLHFVTKHQLNQIDAESNKFLKKA
jgi:hypothetical protein